MSELAINKSENFSTENIQSPFPRKLWRCASSDHLTFIKWGRNGKSIIISDTEKFGIYLESEESMFMENKFYEFQKRLSDHDFHCVSTGPKVLEITHKYFRRGQLRNLHCIVDKKVQNDMLLRVRQRDDPCFKTICTLTRMQIHQLELNVAQANKIGQLMMKAANIGLPVPNEFVKYHHATDEALKNINRISIPQTGRQSMAHMDCMKPRSGCKRNKRTEDQGNMPSTRKQCNTEDLTDAWKQWNSKKK